MSTFQLEIDDRAITAQIDKIINEVFNREMKRKYGDTGEALSKAVSEIVYSHKDEIIEKVIDRAAAEITKKALPKLIKRLSDE